MGFKLVILIFLIAVFSGCIAGQKEENIMEKISISTDAFGAGDRIPDEYTCTGKNVSPAFSWSGVPANTKSLALIMDDPDAPGGTFVHWVLFNIPPETKNLSKGIAGNKTLADGSRHGKTDFDRMGYGGPCPPPGKPHRYYFRIYALDTKLDLQPAVTKTQIEKAMSGHILAKGEIIGIYAR
jgi:Raf kinase inhibitor-like YbhB/YbcL family protein